MKNQSSRIRRLEERLIGSKSPTETENINGPANYFEILLKAAEIDQEADEMLSTWLEIQFILETEHGVCLDSKATDLAAERRKIDASWPAKMWFDDALPEIEMLMRQKAGYLLEGKDTPITVSMPGPHRHTFKDQETDRFSRTDYLEYWRAMGCILNMGQQQAADGAAPLKCGVEGETNLVSFSRACIEHVMKRH